MATDRQGARSVTARRSHLIGAGRTARRVGLGDRGPGHHGAPVRSGDAHRCAAHPVGSGGATQRSGRGTRGRTDQAALLPADAARPTAQHPRRPGRPERRADRPRDHATSRRGDRHDGQGGGRSGQRRRAGRSRRPAAPARHRAGRRRGRRRVPRQLYAGTLRADRARRAAAPGRSASHVVGCARRLRHAASPRSTRHAPRESASSICARCATRSVAATDDDGVARVLASRRRPDHRRAPRRRARRCRPTCSTCASPAATSARCASPTASCPSTARASTPPELDRRTTATVPAGDKLAGASLGNFSAFISERWRANDWMWGRLDAAKSIVDVTTTKGRLRGEHATMLVTAIERDRHRARSSCPWHARRRGRPSSMPPRPTLWQRYAATVAAELRTEHDESEATRLCTRSDCSCCAASGRSSPRSCPACSTPACDRSTPAATPTPSPSLAATIADLRDVTAFVRRRVGDALVDGARRPRRRTRCGRRPDRPAPAALAAHAAEAVTDVVARHHAGPPPRPVRRSRWRSTWC